MTPATALLNQLLPLVLAAVGGWLARHYGLLGPKTPAFPTTTPAAPVAPSTAPATPAAHPLLQAAEQQALALFEQAVQDALARMSPPAAPPKIAG